MQFTRMSTGPVPLEERRIAVDGVEVFSRVSAAESQPAGPTLVMVHGLVISSSFFVPAATRYERRMQPLLVHDYWVVESLRPPSRPA